MNLETIMFELIEFLHFMKKMLVWVAGWLPGHY